MIMLTKIDPQSTGTTKIFGFTLESAKLADGFTYVTVDSLSDAFTVDRKEQHERLQQTPSRFEDYLVLVNFPTSEPPKLCLRIDFVPDFVITLDYSGVTDERVREVIFTIFDHSRIVLAKKYGLASREDLDKLREIEQAKWNGYLEQITN